MILHWIQNKLTQRLNQKKHEVIKLKWQQAELQKRLNSLQQADSNKQ